MFLLYGRKDYEEMKGKRFEYLKGVNAHREMALDVDAFEEVDKEYINALENDAASIFPPTLEPRGQRTCFIEDPEENVIGIGSWNKK